MKKEELKAKLVEKKEAVKNWVKENKFLVGYAVGCAHMTASSLILNGVLDKANAPDHHETFVVWTETLDDNEGYHLHTNFYNKKNRLVRETDMYFSDDVMPKLEKHISDSINEREAWKAVQRESNGTV